MTATQIGGAAEHHHAHGQGQHDHHHHHGTEHQTGPRHEHPLESYAHVQGGMPVLDIGGDVGALVVTTDPAAVGTELYLRSERDPDLHVHTGVWRREATGGFTTTAVFLELLAGAYWVLDDEGADVCPVEINGGELTELDIRS